jgi:hypothetical protein
VKERLERLEFVVLEHKSGLWQIQTSDRGRRNSQNALAAFIIYSRMCVRVCMRVCVYVCIRVHMCESSDVTWQNGLAHYISPLHAVDVFSGRNMRSFHMKHQHIRKSSQVQMDTHVDL